MLLTKFQNRAPQPANPPQGREQFQHADICGYMVGGDKIERAHFQCRHNYKKSQANPGWESRIEQGSLPAPAQEANNGGYQVEQRSNPWRNNGRKWSIEGGACRL